MLEKQNTRQRRKKNIALLAVFLFMRTQQTKQAGPNFDISKTHLMVPTLPLCPSDKMIAPIWACHYGPLTTSKGPNDIVTTAYDNTAELLTCVKNWRKFL